MTSMMGATVDGRKVTQITVVRAEQPGRADDLEADSSVIRADQLAGSIDHLRDDVRDISAIGCQQLAIDL